MTPNQIRAALDEKREIHETWNWRNNYKFAIQHLNAGNPYVRLPRRSTANIYNDPRPYWYEFTKHRALSPDGTAIMHEIRCGEVVVQQNLEILKGNPQ